MKHFDPKWEIVIEETGKDSTGTVCRGYIRTPFGAWTYREVRWSLSTEKAANIAAILSNAHEDQTAVKPAEKKPEAEHGC